MAGVGTSAVPAARFGTGSGILNMARQIGTVLGVAGLVAVLSRLAIGDPVTSFRRAVVLVAALFAGAGAIAAILLTTNHRHTSGDL